MNLSAQNIEYQVKSTNDLSITRTQLLAAKSLPDLITGYPSSWITDYVSTEISIATLKTSVNAKGINDVLTTPQISALKTAKIGEDLNVKVVYKNMNSVSHIKEESTMDVTFKIIPEIEAEYSGGTENMNKYLSNEAVNKIKNLKIEDDFFVSIKFVVNEEGRTEISKINSSKYDKEIENLLVDTIQKMPKWKPAQDSEGSFVKQEFEFKIGKKLGGC
jgi:hypothetical protein